MYQCPNCGGNLKFDIKSQMLKCENCQTEENPYKITKDGDAEENNMFDVTIFTCPQCGGEILGSETSAAEFCSYCGASTILTSRVSRKRRPGYIIPFQKTKEDCKAAYMKLLRKSLFAPKELSDQKHIDSFRGIYMPYWSYHIANNGAIELRGEKSFRRGDYVYTDHYKLGCYLNSYYKGISYDGLSSFDDTISESIAPYDVRGMKEFTPSILSGFYADVSDVDCNIYIEDAEVFANNNTFGEIDRCKAFSGIHISKPASLSTANAMLGTQCREIDSAMFPVWFMSYRKGDRVAYAVVNGQTGKVTADIPVSVSKYLLGSLLIALPIFFFLNIFFTAIPTTTLSIACAMALISDIISLVELCQIRNKEARVNDKGYLYKTNRLPKKEKTIKQRPPKASVSTVLVIIRTFLICIGAFIFLGTALSAAKMLILPACLTGTLIVMIISFVKSSTMSLGTGFPTHLPVFLAVCAANIVCLMNPAQDIYYYTIIILIMIAVITTNIGIINKHNILATRRMPQFDRKGGDDRA